MIGQVAINRVEEQIAAILLNPEQNSPRAQDFAERLESRIVGQERDVRQMSNLYQIFLAGMNSKNRPIGTLLVSAQRAPGKHA